ncbi:MAG: asparagine synthase C-terminal domain-containing protein [Candidatus Methanomethylicaceae archaeon]
MTLKEELVKLLRIAILRGSADGIILSGGVDSSLLAGIASKLRSITGVTVAFNGARANDVRYSSLVAERVGIKCKLRTYSIEEAADAAKEVVRITMSFDHIAIRNDITVYLALKTCAEEGISIVMTGDGGDELFAGYEYMTRMSEHELSKYINLLSEVWAFSSPLLAQSLGLEIVQPYLDREVVDFAKRLPYQWRVMKSDRVYGKWILRAILKDLGLPEIACREKEPIETGSGSSIISKILLEELGDEAEEIEEEALREGIKFWSREQIYFYKIFKETFGKIPKANEGERGCACCGAPLNPKKINCNICGFLNEGRRDG